MEHHEWGENAMLADGQRHRVLLAPQRLSCSVAVSWPGTRMALGQDHTARIKFVFAGQQHLAPALQEILLEKRCVCHKGRQSSNSGP